MSTIVKLGATLALGILIGGLAAGRRLRRLHEYLRVAEYAATHDELTGLPNRTVAEQALTSRQRYGLPTAVILIDLDGFKAINDTYSHHAGDDVLRAVGMRLAGVAAAHQGVAARLGGDEFLLLLPGGHARTTDTDPLGVHPSDAIGPFGPVAIVDITDTVEHTLSLLAQPVRLHTDDGPVTIAPVASAGIAVVRAATTIVADAFAAAAHQADVALYHAKQSPVRCVTYQPDLHMPPNAGRHGPRLRDQEQRSSQPPAQPTHQRVEQPVEQPIQRPERQARQQPAGEAVQ
ncbi:diguanylate cyclase [Dactylosporangium sp. AC04546]|uniref:diguanylate cyclase domain-containing protein n=1 Tax=Dactylosporangium sp. AC04546 TaxID=2862460 RepID=UPI001EDF8FAA|nr:diguanylate cyclase [Dactylosporangium sp. AC04546]WVK78918.1 diguanylate cyclase [Dactylosporangium sp. AC04546]